MSETIALWLEARPERRVWGGNRISGRLGLRSEEPIGELWLAYDQNQVKSGEYAGYRLVEVLPRLGPTFLGSAPYARYGLELPLLVKFLDTAEWLSVQVHPDDAYAHSVEAATGFHGKTEAWYILEGEGELIYGLARPATRAELEIAFRSGQVDPLLRRQWVVPGHVIYVPAGTIHALGPGLLLYEVQQRSDLTYRLYDYGRPREMHLEKGLEVARLEPTAIPDPQPQAKGAKDLLLASEAFVLERYRLESSLVVHAPKESFLLLTLIRGEARWAEDVLGWGDTLLIGAGREVELGGQAEFLGSFVPSLEWLSWYPASLRV